MAWHQRYPLAAALAILAALLVGVVAIEAAVGPRPADVEGLVAGKRAAAVDSKLLPLVAAVNAEQAYPETTARPIFTPTRRPAPEAAAPGQNSFTPGQYVLQGVIIVGDNRVAMLREKANGRIHRVERGREVNGIKVVEIEPEAVKLALGGQSEVVPLTVQKAGAAPGAPAVAGQPGPFAAPPQAPAAPAPPPPAQQAAPALGFTPSEAAARAAAASQATPLQGLNPGQSSLPQATPGAPLTPEELLARRRARRAQPNQ